MTASSRNMSKLPASSPRGFAAALPLQSVTSQLLMEMTFRLGRAHAELRFVEHGKQRGHQDREQLINTLPTYANGMERLPRLGLWLDGK